MKIKLQLRIWLQASKDFRRDKWKRLDLLEAVKIREILGIPSAQISLTRRVNQAKERLQLSS